VELFADIADLEARLGRSLREVSDYSRATAVLEDATALVREEVGYALWTDAGTGLVDPATVPASVRAIVLRAAERAMRNPGGFSAESSGDYSYQRTGVQMGVYLTEGEQRLLRRFTNRSGLWTQPVTRNDVYADVVFARDQYGGDWMPIDNWVEGRNTY
jgi:hypothetical protein